MWFPGCGTSLAPRAFAELGFDVLCTDISTIAISRQAATAGTALTSTARGLVDAQQRSGPPTRMRVRLHDFRTAIDEALFDVIINARAIQGLALDDLHAVARGHHAALRPGGYAILDTQNVQGAGRDRLEGALQDAGFLVPLFEANAWHRQALQATGVAFAMTLGRPIALSRAAADQARLEALSGEYLARANAEVARTRARFEAPDARVALVVYSTG